MKLLVNKETTLRKATDYYHKKWNVFLELNCPNAKCLEHWINCPVTVL
uniref:Uncharacterized protein n=1 Tax=Anguilla anguilla TaxID=7936 RepID=A0A0E9SN38_ANGAN